MEGADYRDSEKIGHSVCDLVSQRVYGLALGYEDLNDDDDLRNDPLLAVMVGKKDPTGRYLRRPVQEGADFTEPGNQSGIIGFRWARSRERFARDRAALPN
jgi:hypothetical protein